MKIGDFNLLDDEQPSADLANLIAGFNANQTAYPCDRTVHAEFQRQAEATPDALAIVGPEGSRSYAEVAARAHRIAHLLVTNGLEREGLVGVMVDQAYDVATASPTRREHAIRPLRADATGNARALSDWKSAPY